MEKINMSNYEIQSKISVLEKLEFYQIVKKGYL